MKAVTYKSAQGWTKISPLKTKPTTRTTEKKRKPSPVNDWTIKTWKKPDLIKTTKTCYSRQKKRHVRKPMCAWLYVSTCSDFSAVPQGENLKN